MDAQVILQTKVCSKCGQEKTLDEFYKHKSSSLSVMGKCKECTKKDVAEYRKNNIEKIREYDRTRGKLPHRIKENTDRTKIYRKQNKEKYIAHQVLGNALRAGKVKKGVCAVCGTSKRIEAHHFDYSKPLEVIWVCSAHHKAIHYPRIY